MIEIFAGVALAYLIVSGIILNVFLWYVEFHRIPQWVRGVKLFIRVMGDL